MFIQMKSKGDTNTKKKDTRGAELPAFTKIKKKINEKIKDKMSIKHKQTNK